jgi:hypothetical protein
MPRLLDERRARAEAMWGTYLARVIVGAVAGALVVFGLGVTIAYWRAHGRFGSQADILNWLFGL